MSNARGSRRSDSEPTLSEKEAQAAADRERDLSIIQQWRDPRRKPLSLSHAHHSPSLAIGAASLRFKTSFRNTIYSVLLERGWRESSDEVEWDVHWTSKEWIKNILPKIHLYPNQFINHFRNYYELTRKDLLIKNLKRAKIQFLKQGEFAVAEKYDFYPDTYNLPGEYLLFVDAFKKYNSANNNSNLWIAKPIGSSQGKGIFLFDKLSAISEWSETFSASTSMGGNSGSSNTNNHYNTSTGADTDADDNTDNDAEDQPVERYIVQKYLSSPLLIGGKKFDMRIYVLVTNYEPLNVFIHRQAFARFSTTRYDNNNNNRITNNFMHLTNVAIQKYGKDYDSISGGKLNLSSLKSYLRLHHPASAVQQAFSLITELIYYSLVSVKPLIIKDKHCFELYGYDVLFDAQCKPWLIEVNASPSLSANTPEDEGLKKEMLHDTFNALEVERWISEKIKGKRARAKSNQKYSAIPTNIASKMRHTKPTNTTSGGTGRTASTSKSKYEADAALNEYFYGGEFDRIGGFDCVYREQFGGLRLDAEGRALNHIGDHNDREHQLNALWKRMLDYDENERRESELAASSEIKQQQQRSREREKKRNEKKIVSGRAQ